MESMGDRKSITYPMERLSRNTERMSGMSVQWKRRKGDRYTYKEVMHLNSG